MLAYRGATLTKVVREGLFEEETFGLRPEQMKRRQLGKDLREELFRQREQQGQWS